MKSISISEYNQSMGQIIDVEDNYTFSIKHVPNALNIPYETLLYNKDNLLDKNKIYYIYCQGGHKSRRAVNILTAYGFKVVQVLLN